MAKKRCGYAVKEAGGGGRGIEQKGQIEISDEAMRFFNYIFSWYTILSLKELKAVFLFIVRVL